MGVTPFAEKHQKSRLIEYRLKAEGFEEQICVGTLDPRRALIWQVFLKPKEKATPPTDEVYWGEVIHKENIVRFSRKGGAWKDVEVGLKLMVGDRIQTGENSRVGISKQGSTLRLHELTTFEVTGDAKLRLESGKTFFFHREKLPELKIETPAANGVLKG